MPQAKSGGSRRSGASSGTRRTRTSSARSSGSSTSSRSGGGARGRSTRSRTRSSSAAAGSADARFEAAAQRLRRLNERIIEASKEAGETTLNSYERALKTIATTLERGPGSSDIEWISAVASAQAKLIRDVTEAWTSAARKMLQ